MSKAAAVVLTIIPVIILIFVVANYGLTSPFWDQWDFIPTLVKAYDGTLGFGDLFAWHSEHRPFFPRLIALLFAYPSHWNIAYELALNVILGILLFLTLVLQIKKTAQVTKLSNLYFTIPLMSILVFSMSQWENWIWGWQIQVWLAVFCSTAGIFLLTNFPSSYKWFFISLLLGMIAIYSFVSGISYLVMGFLILLFDIRNKRAAIFFKILIWVSISTVLLAVYYFSDRQAAVQFSHVGQLIKFLYEPLKFLQFISFPFAFLGGPFAFGSLEVAITLGILCVLLMALLPLILIRRFKSSVITPYVYLNIFVIGVTLMTGLGRIELNALQAISSRYITFALLAWSSNAAMLSLLLFKTSTFKNLSNRNFIRRTVFIALGTIVLLALSSSFAAIWELKNRHKIWLKYQSRLAQTNNPQELLSFYDYFYPDKDKFIERVNLMRAYKLSIFR